MFLILKVAGIVLILLAIYMDLLAWRILRDDQTLKSAQRHLQYLFVLFFPFIGACVSLRLCELANPGLVQKRAVPWPFRAIVVERPIMQNPDAETEEQYKKRMFNI